MRRNSILFNSVFEWNLLPEIYKNVVSIDLFKKTVFIHFFKGIMFDLVVFVLNYLLLFKL